jgi:hypothetical protein
VLVRLACTGLTGIEARPDAADWRQDFFFSREAVLLQRPFEGLDQAHPQTLSRATSFT